MTATSLTYTALARKAVETLEQAHSNDQYPHICENLTREAAVYADLARTASDREQFAGPDGRATDWTP